MVRRICNNQVVLGYFIGLGHGQDLGAYSWPCVAKALLSQILQVSTICVLFYALLCNNLAVYLCVLFICNEFSLFHTRMHACMHTHIIHMHAHVNTCTHMYARTYAHLHIHTHTHTHTHTHHRHLCFLWSSGSVDHNPPPQEWRARCLRE